MRQYGLPIAALMCFFLMSLMAGCVTTDYIGETYPPTSHADLYFDKQDIKRDYKVMGQITLDADDFISTEQLQQKMLTEAMARGADTLLFIGIQTIRTGQNTVWQDTGKNKGKHYHESGVASTQYEEKKQVTGSLVKYIMLSAPATQPLNRQ